MDQLKELRNHIDHIDSEILRLLGKRFEIVKKIGILKKEQKVPIIDEEREEEKIENAIREGKTYSIDADFIRKLLKHIFKYSYDLEK